MDKSFLPETRTKVFATLSKQRKKMANINMAETNKPEPYSNKQSLTLNP